MRTDPRDACANERQRLLWALIHDGLAHPLMALTGYCKAAVAFHDWTSHKAWPRIPEQLVAQLDPLRMGKPYSMRVESLDRDFVEQVAERWHRKGCPFCLTSEPHYHADGKIYYIYKLEEL